VQKWYEEWFNTDEYLNVYRHRNEIDAGKLVDLIIKFVNIPPNGTVLDLACGAGRHSILFAKKGYKVTAVDLSINLLKVAKLSAEEQQVDIEFIQGDMRSFSINQKFDLVVNLFTSFGYFETDEDNFAVFTKAKDLLKPSGFFVFDYFNSHYLRNNLIPSSVDLFNGSRIEQIRRIEGERVVKEISIRRGEGDERKYLESVRIYSKEEIVVELKNRGFEIDAVFGDFNGNPFTLESSPRIIIIARK
jgi:2-polyprenyl-3-methyl-5-hydroxy-6-metoxy-1,4-benzoquinol methylase